jgi:hypothetical protein
MRVDDSTGIRVLYVDADGPAAREANDFIGDAWSEQATLVAVPAARLDPEFFRLRSLIAGEFIQKFVNYRIQLAVVGDISAHVEASDALRDFVWESNRGDHVWFVADEAALTQRLIDRA